MTYPRFPLQDGEYFAFGLKPREHPGIEEVWLSVAQRNLRVRWRFKNVKPSGWMDLETSAAVCSVQELIGHTPNGELDQQTWDAIFTKSIVDPL